MSWRNPPFRNDPTGADQRAWANAWARHRMSPEERAEDDEIEHEKEREAEARLEQRSWHQIRSSYQATRRNHMSIADEINALEHAADSPLAILRDAPHRAAAIASRTRQSVAQARHDYPTGEYGRELERATRAQAAEDLKDVEARVLIAKDLAGVTIARAMEHVTDGTTPALERQAARDRLLPLLASPPRHAGKDQGPLQWVERRAAQAKAAGRVAELEVLRTEVVDRLAATGVEVPAALRRQLLRATGDDLVVRAVDLGELVEKGAYRVAVALNHIAGDVAGTSTAPVVPGFGQDELIQLATPAPETWKDRAEARVAATRDARQPGVG